MSSAPPRIQHFFKARPKLERYYVQIAHRNLLYPTQPPTKLRIDASTICQLRCEGCGFQLSGHRGLKGGFLSAGRFKKLIDSYPQVKRVELSNYGEIFLNPERYQDLPCWKCPLRKGRAQYHRSLLG